MRHAHEMCALCCTCEGTCCTLYRWHMPSELSVISAIDTCIYVDTIISILIKSFNAIWMNKFKQSYQFRNCVASSTPYITTCYCYFNAQVHYPLGRSQYSRGQDHQLYTTGWREEQNGSYSCLTKRSGGQTKSVSHMTGMFITLARKGMKFVVNIKIKAVFHSWNELGYSECCSTCWDGKYPFQTDLNLPFAVWRHLTCLFR